MEVRRGNRTVVPAAMCGLLLAAACLVSCGKTARPPVTEIPGYLQLRDVVGDYDFTPLRGRRIVVDAGHGGLFRGAVGLNGLSEAEVNLGVTLYLRGLLEWAGVEVHLTRTADYDFLTPADSSVAFDLAARIAVVDSIQPDVFLSIHHNSNSELDRDMNETQTYYPMGREGADLDLARSIHKYLVRNLQIEPAKIMAGNFFVLRNSPVPAVLGEPSMISNPVIEGRLSQARSLEIEATAYFLGLLEYFAGGMPRFVCEFGDTIVGREAGHQPISWYFETGSADAPGLDPTSILFSVDDQPADVAVSADGRLLTWHPAQEWLYGQHELVLSGRNLLGRSTPTVGAVWIGHERYGFTTQFSAPADENTEGDLALFSWSSLGAPLSEYPHLSLTDADDRRESRILLPVYPGTRGWLLIPVKDFPVGAQLRHAIGDEISLHRIDLRRSRLPAHWHWTMLQGCRKTWPTQVVPGGAWRPRSPEIMTPDNTVWRVGGKLTFDPTAPLVEIRDGTSFWLEADGAHPIFADEHHLPPWSEPGTAPPDTFHWRPVLAELIDTTIVLDPAGGGSEDDGIGPLGTRGADLNLRVAEKTASLLRGAGANVVLSRTDERWLPAEEKVLRTNDVDADLFLTIRRNHDPACLAKSGHYPNSRTGRTWAQLFARVAAPIYGTSTETVAAAIAAAANEEGTTTGPIHIGPSYAYLLRHTACPALEVGLELPTDFDSEDRLLDPSHQQAEARALFLSIASLLAGEEILTEVVHPGTLLTENTDRFPPLDRIDWIKLDGNFLWLPPRWCPPATDTIYSSVSPGLPCRGVLHTLEIHA
ncbi:MAG: N-acetylmuramoyl-L-alanine amidase, partial [bacterium]